METVNQILSWLNANETALSALAALVVIVGVTLSPLGAGMRGLLSRRQTNDSAMPGTDITKPTTSSAPDSAPDLKPSAAQDFLTTLPPLITDKPSIAVLPFVNMSKDEDKEFFADGMTEDIITGLSCDSRLFVIARNSTFAYKGQSPDIRTVGKELGVRYVLEGSIRPVADRLRITVQLIETDTGTHIWAEKIDRPVAEIFDIQDDVVDSLVTTLCANLGVAEGQRTDRQIPDNLKAWELCIKAEMAHTRQLTPASVAESQSLVNRAIEIEPGYAIGWAMLSQFTTMSLSYLLTDNPTEQAELAISYATKAITLAPGDPSVLGYAGWGATFAGQANTGIGYLEQSLAINPNSGVFRMLYAHTLNVASRKQEALKQFDIFFRQSPKDPNIGRAHFFKSITLSTLAHYAEAEQSAALAIKHAPSFSWAHVVHAMALAGQERYDEARQAMNRAREMAPHFTLQRMEAFFQLLFTSRQDSERINDLARKAWSDS